MLSHQNAAVLTANIPAQGTAATVQSRALGRAPFAGRITSARIIPEAAVTGNATNFRNFRIVNKGQTGAGTTLMASFATNATPANDLVAYDEKAAALSGTEANTLVAAGDILQVDETVGGSGVAHGGYRVEVTLEKF